IREAVQAALAFETDRCVSLANSFARASMHDMLLDQRKLTDQVSASRVIARLAAGESNADVLPTLAGGGGRQALVEFAKTSKFPLKARIYHLLTEASGDTDFEEACWQSVNDHLLAHTDIPDGARVAFARDEASVSLPVRVNFGGGWSDTPPYCLEFGGTVLNASVLLGGQKPVRALAKRIDAPVIRIQSDDLGVSKEYTRFEHLHTGDPGDPHALCKAALLVCGATRGDARGDLRDWLSDIGGGILIRTSVIGVPKGSGLGTSSILSAATVRALAQLFGQPNDDAHIASLTLLAEQVMSTGGGWQDQIGGLLPGIKLTSSRCGTPQRMTWRTIQMPSEAFRELSDRFALIYTGQRRLARNILRDIMGKVIARNPETLRILSEIQRLAILMAFELETGNIDAFTQLLTEHWALSKQLDAGSSNTCIDHMIAICEDLLDGCMIAGAGGGGFLSVIMKKGVPREALSDRLDAVFQDSGVKVWDAAIG
ncbi:MAG: bifunctional fucokinase/L-fucose-1-P-guanylyltransferase, partial [Clostridia bacterium]|nr:bifunctional fucokinase/L-fucose-1-P-guanylyltransferase [Clostridia bacterium]